jgi:hypothetical protein
MDELGNATSESGLVNNTQRESTAGLLLWRKMCIFAKLKCVLPCPMP